MHNHTSYQRIRIRRSQTIFGEFNTAFHVKFVRRHNTKVVFLRVKNKHISHISLKMFKKLINKFV